jgi:glycosyltransferase involved in cell wall biosynthesis
MQRLGFLVAAPRISTHPDAEMSGPRARVLGIIGGFQALGWEVNPFIVGDRVPPKWSAKGSGATISRGFLRTLAVDFIRLYLGCLNTVKSWQALKAQVDWVYEYAATLQCLGWFFQWQGIPWILQAEALLFYEAKVERKALVLDKLAQWMEIQAYRKCDVLACVSQTLKDILVQDFGISEHKIVLVPNGVDLDFLDPNKHVPKRIFSGFTIGFVGSLYAWAGLDLLLEVIHEMRSEGVDLSLVILGDGTMKPAWEKLTEQLGLAQHVAFLGRVNALQVPQYIAGCDIGYSGQVQLQMGKMYLSPMKLYEYMSMAKPVLAANFEDAQRLVGDDERGFLFESNDKQDLKRALTKVLENREKLPQIGQSARTEMELNHSWAARVNVLVEGTRRILEQSASHS